MREKFFRILLCVALFAFLPAQEAGASAISIEQQIDAYIGREVVLSLGGEYINTPGAVFEWSFDGSARSILLRKGGLECRFTPYEIEPVTASVNAFDAAGNKIASASLAIPVKEFKVNIALIERERILLWDIGAKKDVPAEGIIAGEPIPLKASLAPEYKGEVKCSWSVDASTAILNKEDAKNRDATSVTVVRSEVGDSEIAVVVTDAKGLILGQGSVRVSVPIARGRIAESARRRDAWTQWTKAQTQWQAKEYDAASETAKGAASADPENMELSDGVKTMLAHYARIVRARKLTADADALAQTKKYDSALKTMRRSFAAWPLDGTEDNIKNLELTVEEIRLREQQVEWLKDTASAYDQEGLFSEALQYYRETLSMISDDAIAQRANRIEVRMAERVKAAAMAEEARALEENGHFMSALGKYKDSLKLEANPDVETHVRELDEAIKDRRAKAATLRREGSDLQKKNNNADALVRYMESQALWADPDLEKRIAAMKKTFGEPSANIRTPEDFGIGTQADATRLLRMGHDLYSEGKYREALLYYRRSYAISGNSRLRSWIERVETPLKEYEAVQKANALIKEGNDLYSDGKLQEALTKYKESLSVHSNAEVDSFAKNLEAAIKSSPKPGAK
ncbi:hypothetical protein FACS1894204_12370 [Synergistales bacterium]|nr:hypothetical protein FACS1894204_12370 [Synergistales bacterium]